MLEFDEHTNLLHHFDDEHEHLNLYFLVYDLSASLLVGVEQADVQVVHNNHHPGG